MSNPPRGPIHCLIYNLRIGVRVKGPVDSSNGGKTLGEGDAFQLSSEALDLVGDRRRADGGERGVHGDARRPVDPVVGERWGVGVWARS